MSEQKSGAMTPLERLEAIYSLHDRYAGKYTVACHKGCAACCTCNVTLTTLETDYLVRGMTASEKQALVQRVSGTLETKRFRPCHTINGIAAGCLAGEAVPEEENDPAWGECPLLEAGVCMHYDRRPLGCRMLLSRVACREAGAADMPDLVVTLNNVFMQVVEHLDAGGRSGNFADMIFWRLQGRGGQGGMKKEIGPTAFNRKAPVFMVPPEHRAAVAPVMEALSRVMA